MGFENYDLTGFDSSKQQRKLQKSLLSNSKIKEVVINKNIKQLIIETTDTVGLDYINKEIKKINKKAEAKVHENKEVYRKVVYLTNLDCANCALKVENLAKRMLPHEQIVVDFSTTRFMIETTDKSVADDIIKRVEKIAHVIDPNIVVEEKGSKKETNKPKDKAKISKFIFMGIGVVLLVVSILLEHAFKVKNQYVIFALYFAAFIASGWDVLKQFLNNILHLRFFDETFLMSIASIGAIIIGEYPEAVLVMVLYQIGEFLQDLAVNRSRDSISELLKMEVSTCHLKTENNTVDVEVETVMPGDTIIVMPNEMIPVDGVIVSGSTYLDTASITGEAIPVYKKVGEEVISGCVNTKNRIEVKVTHQYSNSMINRILELVESASSNKAKAETFINKFAKVYTPVVVILALIVAFLIPTLTDHDYHKYIYKALEFLVVSCPCSVVISVPLAFFGGIGLSSKRGILIKGSNYLEVLSNVDTVVFDKTGTLTKGSFEVVDVRSVDEENFGKDKVLRSIAYAEYNSVHPIGISIVEKYGRENIIPEIISSYRVLDGYGVEAIANGNKIVVVNQKYLKDNELNIEYVHETGTTLYAFRNDQYIGCVIIGDILKEEAYNAIQELKNVGVTKTVMLTGDHKSSGEYTANMLQITDVYTDLLPDDKVQIVKNIMKNEKNKLMYVGDGVNDAPVIAASDIGVAMGDTGSDVTIQVADAVIMSNNLHKVAEAIKIAKKTKNRVIENIVFSLILKIAVLIIAYIVDIPLIIPVFADVGVCLLTILNSMRLLATYKVLEKQEQRSEQGK